MIEYLHVMNVHVFCWPSVVLSYVLIVCTVPLPLGVNLIAVDKYININITQLLFSYYWQLHLM